MNMSRYTNAELVAIHFIYGIANGNGRFVIPLRLRSRTNRRWGPFNFQNRQTARNFKIGKVKTIPRIHGWWIKKLSMGNCVGQLVLTMRGERRFKRIVRGQRRQTLSQITSSPVE
ncbi:hypothetical protein TNCV_2760461 [Trichonephila clavipes]|nr:hypothetical protein TNCV_2760461 [Trichonephila clavipes]